MLKESLSSKEQKKGNTGGGLECISSVPVCLFKRNMVAHQEKQKHIPLMNCICLLCFSTKQDKQNTLTHKHFSRHAPPPWNQVLKRFTARWGVSKRKGPIAHPVELPLFKQSFRNKQNRSRYNLMQGDPFGFEWAPFRCSRVQEIDRPRSLK